MNILLLLPIVPLLILCANLLTWHRPHGNPKKSSTRVSVLIPVRNEEWNIATCLQHVYN